MLPRTLACCSCGSGTPKRVLCSGLVGSVRGLLRLNPRFRSSLVTLRPGGRWRRCRGCAATGSGMSLLTEVVDSCDRRRLRCETAQQAGVLAHDAEIGAGKMR